MRILYVSHNGLGDNISCIGVLRCLASYYETVHYTCKRKYMSNILGLLDESLRSQVILEPFDCKGSWPVEIEEVFAVVQRLRKAYDVDVSLSGLMWQKVIKAANNPWLAPTLRHRGFLQLCRRQAKRAVSGSQWNSFLLPGMTPFDIQHIAKFYADVGMVADDYLTHWDVVSTSDSRALAEELAGYTIIVLCQARTSTGEELSTDVLRTRHDADAKAIVLCTDFNAYSKPPIERSRRSEIAEKFVMQPLSSYVDTLHLATHICTVDSCLSCLVIPLAAQGKLAARAIEIVPRREVHRWPRD